MKFSDIREEEWEQLRPYLDTCVLPLTALSGREQPSEVVKKLEHLRDALDFVEIPFKGRIVTYPALHYSNVLQGQALTDMVDEVGRKLKDSGFAFVVVVVTESYPDLKACTSIDLVIEPFENPELSSREIQKVVQKKMQQLWMTS